MKCVYILSLVICGVSLAVPSALAYQKNSDAFFQQLLRKAGYANPEGLLVKSAREAIRKQMTVKQCFGDYGCFSSFEVDDKENITLGNLQILYTYASSPQELDVNFLIFRRSARPSLSQISYNASDAQIRSTPYNGTKKTIFITHGFRDFYMVHNWNERIKNAILDGEKSRDYNVIIVDWSIGSVVTNYMHAVGNTQVVAAVIARFIRNLMRLYKQTPDDFVLVGHSLGAQISGQVGHHFTEPKIRMIVGLDPAGPGFHFVKKKYRLDEEDARLVLDVHTNAGEVNNYGINLGAGIMKPSGHYSIYVNGGSMTYGCVTNTSTTNLFSAIGTLSCSHSYSTALMSGMETRTPFCSPVAYRCKSYHQYLNGECHECSNQGDCMLFHSFFSQWIDYAQPPPTVPNTYIVSMTHQFPFCAPTYLLKLKVLATNLQSPPKTFFNIRINVAGTLGETSFNFRQKVIPGLEDKEGDIKEGFQMKNSKTSLELSSVVALDRFVGKVEQMQMILYTVKESPESVATSYSWWRAFNFFSFQAPKPLIDRIHVLPVEFKYLSEEKGAIRKVYSRTYVGPPHWIESNKAVSFNFEL